MKDYIRKNGKIVLGSFMFALSVLISASLFSSFPTGIAELTGLGLSVIILTSAFIFFLSRTKTQTEDPSKKDLDNLRFKAKIAVQNVKHPLYLITLYSSKLSEVSFSPPVCAVGEEVAKEAEKIRDSMEKLSDALNGIQTENMKVTSVSDEISNAVKKLASLTSGKNIIVSVSPDICIKGDAKHISALFEGIMFHQIKSAHNQVTVSGRTENTLYALYVYNDGDKISAFARKTLFSEKNKVLFACRAAAQALNGSINYVPSKEGNLFRITVPYTLSKSK